MKLYTIQLTEEDIKKLERLRKVLEEKTFSKTIKKLIRLFEIKEK